MSFGTGSGFSMIIHEKRFDDQQLGPFPQPASAGASIPLENAEVCTALNAAKTDDAGDLS
jgi:hypothetical protein